MSRTSDTRTEPGFPLRARWGFSAVVAASCATFLIAAAPPPERGHGIVAADHRLASEAGAEILREGGNAVDAIVAAALAANVVQPSASGLGGGGFAVVVRPGDHAADVAFLLDFREVAPRAASRDMYRTPDGGADSKRSTEGGLSVAVPGASRGLWTLHARLGRLSAADVAAPAIRLASDGFRVRAYLANALGRTKKPEIAAWFVVGGHPLSEGDIFAQPVLAKTLKKWVSSKGEVLSVGAGAEAVARSVAETGGVLDTTDLAAYATVDRKPLIGTYRGYTVVTMPPPSSGGVALLEMLGVLEGYDLHALEHDSADHLHLLAEVMKFAYADRAHDLGDPAFVTVPVDRLLSPERRDAIHREIWPGRTFPPDHYGSAIEPAADHGTEHISVLDAEGMAASLTTTINTAFGSGVVVDDLGLILNDQMDDFSAAPGVPNAYGLVGGEANAIAPGKRPLSSMSPTVLLDPKGHVVMVVGGSGGAQIISSVLQAISNVVDFGMNASEAVAAPRIHDQWQPDELVVEPGIPKDVIAALEARGHHVRVAEMYSAVQLITDLTGLPEGASDPRKDGWPAGAW